MPRTTEWSHILEVCIKKIIQGNLSVDLINSVSRCNSVKNHRVKHANPVRAPSVGKLGFTVNSFQQWAKSETCDCWVTSKV